MMLIMDDNDDDDGKSNYCQFISVVLERQYILGLVILIPGKKEFSLETYNKNVNC